MDAFIKALQYNSVFEWAKTLNCHDMTNMSRLMINTLPVYGALLMNPLYNSGSCLIDTLPIESVSSSSLCPLDLSTKNNKSDCQKSIAFNSSPFPQEPSQGSIITQSSSPPCIQSITKLISPLSVSPPSTTIPSSLSLSSNKRRSMIHKRNNFPSGQLRRGCSKVQTCNQCLEKFFSTKDLDAHTFAIHETYRCTFENCNVTFTQRSNLNRHGMGHMKGDPIHCKICWRGFKRKDHCVKHLQEKHSVTEECGDFVHSRIPTARSLEAIGLFNPSSPTTDKDSLIKCKEETTRHSLSVTFGQTEEDVIDVVN